VTFESECGNKRSYKTKADAKRAEKILRTVTGGSRQHAYRCGYCGDWHCGHGTARRDAYEMTRDVALQCRVSDLEVVIGREREALTTAQTPTQRSYYEKRVADFEMERAAALEAINVATLEEAVQI
jgi:hypothetical protein